MRRLLPWLAGALVLAGAAFGGATLVSWRDVRALAPLVPPDPTPAPIPEGPRRDLLARGRALVIAGDCVSCHLRIGGAPFEGGLGLQTPFGVIYAPNITGDRAAGLGRWTADVFWQALHDGIAPGGRHLYPAFPYNYFVHVDRADSDAMLAYLQTVPGSAYRAPDTLLPLPLKFRPALIGWNLLYLSDAPAVRLPRTARPAVARGQALVDGLGHCSACHTPMTPAGAPDVSRYLRGAVLNGWLAPDLTGNSRAGLGRWSIEDIVAYLRSGRNGRANAGGPMAEVVAYSTSLMPDGDLRDIAAYLKTLLPSPSPVATAAEPAALTRGAAIYASACAACHLPGGRGQPGLFPPLSADAVAQQPDATGLVRIILGGARTAPTATRPSPVTMPAFAWKLSDRDIADVAGFVRQSWGNRAGAVTTDLVAALRRDARLPAPITLP